jgi:chemotaxis methyl-accepting protein methylase
MLRRLAILKLEKIIDYLEYLQQNKPEVDLLFQDMLIPVTEFFRDAKAFEYLCEKIFPELINFNRLKSLSALWENTGSNRGLSACKADMGLGAFKKYFKVSSHLFFKKAFL